MVDKNQNNAFEDTHTEHHIASVATYVKVFFALVVLTLLTVGVYQVHLGPMNLVVAIFIATVKAAMVVVIFMHMRHEAQFNVLLFLGSLLFASIFLAYTLNDTNHRAQLDDFEGASVDPSTGNRAYGSAPELSKGADAGVVP